MKNFAYVNATSLEGVPSLLADNWDEALVIAGGIDLLGELKNNVRSPKRLVNLKTIPNMKYIDYDSKGLRIGALTELSEIESDSRVCDMFTALAQAAAAVGTPQIRNAGTIGGNLCQRPRCWYYRGEYFDCRKKGGDTCYAEEGNSKYLAIFGGDNICYIAHPSDTAPALIALGARVKIVGHNGSKVIPLEEFFILPKVNVERENILKPNEIVAEVQIPNLPLGTRSVYIKMREKRSMDFALVSVAAALTMKSCFASKQSSERGNICEKANIVLGGVAPTPWRAKAVEDALAGKHITEEIVQQAANLVSDGAEPMKDNAYKVNLAKTLVTRAVMMVTG